MFCLGACRPTPGGVVEGKISRPGPAQGPWARGPGPLARTIKAKPPFFNPVGSYEIKRYVFIIRRLTKFNLGPGPRPGAPEPGPGARAQNPGPRGPGP